MPNRFTPYLDAMPAFSRDSILVQEVDVLPYIRRVHGEFCVATTELDLSEYSRANVLFLAFLAEMSDADLFELFEIPKPL